MPTVYLALGSNLGDRRAMLQRAYDAIAQINGVTASRLSPIYETDPVGPQDQGRFLNAAMEIVTTLMPEILRTALAEIETSLGRPDIKDRPHWGPRVIDVDILLYDDLVMHEPCLTIPHPRMADRAFVLKPLADLAPQVLHPVTKKTIAQMLTEIEH